MADSIRYPIGTHERTESYTPVERDALVARIAALPAAMAAALHTHDDAFLDTPYRDGGWTVRQLVHHVADSHSHALIRLKQALTESEPTIMAYDQDAWVTLADARTLSPMVSLSMLAAIHERMTTVLRAMNPAEFSRAFLHPENGRMTIDMLVGLYAWHGDHHVAHINALRARPV